jgi:SAM-dependent methyltransferase
MTWDAAGYDDRFGFVAEYGQGVVDLLGVRPGEQVLDLGCGTGTLTAEIAAQGADVVGLDPDPAMLERARAAHPDVTFRPGDARSFTVDARVDAVFSNAALHWVRTRDQDAVHGCVRAALRDGGRFVGEMGGAGNVLAVREAVDAARADAGHAPVTDLQWCFPSPGEHAARLERHGFTVRSVQLVDRPTALTPGDTPADWLGMFGGPLLADLPAAARREVVGTATDALAPLLRDPGGTWRIDYVRLRWLAVAG